MLFGSGSRVETVLSCVVPCCPSKLEGRERTSGDDPVLAVPQPNTPKEHIRARVCNSDQLRSSLPLVSNNVGRITCCTTAWHKTSDFTLAMKIPQFYPCIRSSASEKLSPSAVTVCRHLQLGPTRHIPKSPIEQQRESIAKIVVPPP
jgi:hypothetical protein